MRRLSATNSPHIHFIAFYSCIFNFCLTKLNCKKMFLITKRIALYTIIVGALASCTKEIEYVDKGVPNGRDVRVVIANEGQAFAGSASLTAITYDGFVKNDVFRSVNKRQLGDVSQSVTEIGDNLYVTLNNSRKIEVMNRLTFQQVETMPTADATIPTYIAHLGGDSIAVGEKGSHGRLMIMDINHSNGPNNIMRRVIEDIGSTNQMKVINGKLFLAGATLRVVDIRNISAKTMRTIRDKSNPDSDKATEISAAGDSKIVSDKNGNLWVLTSAKLYCINPSTEEVIKSYPFNGPSITSWGGRLDIDKSGTQLYFTGEVASKGGVLTMSINDANAPTELLFAHTVVRVLYNMAVSPEGTIFICDVLYGSLARSLVHEYTTKGEIINTFEAGIFAQYIHFMNQ